jgi:hypothetical protein
LLGFLVGCQGAATRPAPERHTLASGRASPADTIIDTSWKFTRADVPGAAEIAFDDSAWQEIRLPHTWNNLDGQDGGNDYYRAISPSSGASIARFTC